MALGLRASLIQAGSRARWDDYNQAKWGPLGFSPTKQRRSTTVHTALATGGLAFSHGTSVVGDPHED